MVMEVWLPFSLGPMAGLTREDSSRARLSLRLRCAAQGCQSLIYVEIYLSFPPGFMLDAARDEVEGRIFTLKRHKTGGGLLYKFR
jgi:hypothetical protein